MTTTHRHSPEASPLALWITLATLVTATPTASGQIYGDELQTPLVDESTVQRSQPFYSTFSICAVDQETGESGAAVTTRVPFVGRAVPWVRASVGAVATQAWTVVEYGTQGLDLMEQGLAPAAVLEQLLADDAGRESRQIGLIDMAGRTAAHTGEENGDWAGSRQGENYTVQANIMVGRQVVDAVANHFEATAGTGMPLAERLILALEAGQALGGDKRWGRLQSAAIRIADPNDPGRGGDHLSVSIDVGEHPELTPSDTGAPSWKRFPRPRVSMRTTDFYVGIRPHFARRSPTTVNGQRSSMRPSHSSTRRRLQQSTPFARHTTSNTVATRAAWSTLASSKS
jgi:uncharacterized Ntn-hydrolase superfamily protein